MCVQQRFIRDMFALFCSTVFVLLLYFYCMITAWSVFEAPLVKMCSLHSQVMDWWTMGCQMYNCKLYCSGNTADNTAAFRSGGSITDDPSKDVACGTRRHSGEHEHVFSVSGRGTRSPFKVCARYRRLLRASEGGEATGTFMGYSSVPCTRMGTAAAVLQEARVLARDAWNCGMAEYERRKLARR